MEEIQCGECGKLLALRRRSEWCQVSANLYGANKARCAASIRKSRAKLGDSWSCGSGYGGHFRAVQGFRYLGEDVP